MSDAFFREIIVRGARADAIMGPMMLLIAAISGDWTLATLGLVATMTGLGVLYAYRKKDGSDADY